MDLVESKNNYVPKAKRHPWELARLKSVEKLLHHEFLNAKDGCIVDIGCGDAFVVNELGAKFPHITFLAVDIAFKDDTLAFYKSHITSPNVSLYSSLDEIVSDIKQKKVIGVLLLDVVEHIEQDVAFLTDLHARPWLDNDTKVFITVPAYKSLFCARDIYLGHYRRYTNQLLKNHLQQAHFAPKKLFYFFTILLLPRILQVIKEKIKSEKPANNTNVEQWNGSKLASKMVVNILYADFLICWFLYKIGIKLPGLSNITVCQKQR